MQFEPTRLVLARRRRGLSITALAKMTGTTSRSISAYENGEWTPNDDSVQAIASVLEFPAEFFLDSALDEVPVDSVSFRALSKMTARQRDAALGAGAIGTLIDSWIQSRFALPSVEVPSLTGYDPEMAAETLRAKWGLGLRPLGNVIHLVESKGVRVYSLPDDTANLDAFSLYRSGRPYIFLNTQKTGERGRFDVAHELGHLVLHQEHLPVHGPSAESEANRFAAAFLMPKGAVVAKGLCNASVNETLAAKGTWQVAAMALTHRLHELNLLTDWGYRANCVQLSRMGYRSSEPNGIPRETSQLLSKVLRELRKEGISTARIADQLNISQADLNSHLFGLALLIA